MVAASTFMAIVAVDPDILGTEEMVIGCKQGRGRTYSIHQAGREQSMGIAAGGKIYPIEIRQVGKNVFNLVPVNNTETRNFCVWIGVNQFCGPAEMAQEGNIGHDHGFRRCHVGGFFLSNPPDVSIISSDTGTYGGAFSFLSDDSAYFQCISPTYVLLVFFNIYGDK
jgi:hypothetical protein